MLCNGLRYFLIPAILAIYSHGYGQENLKVFLHPDKFYKKYLPHLKLKRTPLDTVYIKTYPNYLSVSMHILSPALRLTINTRNPGASVSTSSKFGTSVADIAGFSASYRHVSVGFAFLLKHGLQKNIDYTPSSYHTATIKYSNPIYSLQYRYMKLRGFTEINSLNGSKLFDKRPDIVTKEYQFEGVYNFSWRKYSYLAPILFSQRQMKSRAGILLKGGLYYKRLQGDSALISGVQRQYYEDFGDSKGIQTFSIKLAPGIGGNLVFRKHVYLAGAIFNSFDLYFYRYFTNAGEPTARRESFVFAIDGYASLGYQSERVYAGLRYETDRRNAALRGITMSMINSYIGLEFGYRFDAPRFMKRFYKKTMPPGA